MARARSVHIGAETSEFHTHFREETGAILRRRLLWFIAIWGGLGAVGFIATLALMLSNTPVGAMFSQGITRASIIVLSGIWLLVYIAAMITVLEGRVGPRGVIRISMGLIALDGVYSVVIRAIDPGLGVFLWYFILAHFIACCVFPWTLRQAAMPIAVVLSVSSASHLIFEGTGPVGTLVFAAFTILFNAPALAISSFRHNQRVARSTNRFLSSRYGKLRQELAYARQVHEALFPAPVMQGAVRFSYRYEPMRQIGGDYLHIHHTSDPGSDAESFSAVLVDVTGHGIPAALTVNRLHGEIDLRFAEQPGITPGELLGHLNRYINLTLSKHSIFATAMCVRVEPHENRVLYASGGHPPAFVRSVDGTIRDLEPTTFVLGATGDREFDPGERSIEFHPGDSLIAYTDGATEARSVDGSMLRVEGLRRIIAGAHMLGSDDPTSLQGHWAERILREVATHRGGLPTEDDTLAIEIYRPIRRQIDTRTPSEHAQGVGIIP